MGQGFDYVAWRHSWKPGDFWGGSAILITKNLAVRGVYGFELPYFHRKPYQELMSKTVLQRNKDLEEVCQRNLDWDAAWDDRECEACNHIHEVQESSKEKNIQEYGGR